MSIEIGFVAAFKAAGTVGAAVGVIWAGMLAMDSRYEVQDIHIVEHDVITTGLDNFSYTVLKREIRDIREAMYSITDQRRLQQLGFDLEDAIDRLCRQFPQDRECN